MKNIAISLFSFASERDGAWSLSFLEFWNEDTQTLWTLFGIGIRPDGEFRFVFFESEYEG